MSRIPKTWIEIDPDELFKGSLNTSSEFKLIISNKQMKFDKVC